LRSKKRPSIITWTTSTGLMPYSSVNYKIQYLSTVDGSQLLSPTTQQGTGGLTQLYWSNGVRINKNFSVGLKATYLFGSLNTSTRLQATYVSTGELKNTVKGVNFSLGGSFSKDSLFGRDYRLSIGAVYQFAADPRAHLKNKTALLDNRGDTLQSVNVLTTYGNMHLPSAITAGVSFGTTKWTFGTEFHYQDWSSFQSLNTTDENGSGKSWRMAAGGELTPNQFAPENLLQRLTYRVGGSIEQYPFLGNGQPIKDVGINFGLSVPAGKSSMDLGFKIGKRGDTSKNILEENYFKLFFGITFNDQWFIKRRFD